MEKLSRSFILGFVLALIVLPSLDAQTASSVPAANPTPTGQAPDEVMKKLSELVRAGKYEEAQQLTSGLLAAYPDDQRLLKAKALLDKSLASSKTADPAASSNLPTNNVASVLLTASTKGEPLTGLDKVDYNALIVLARQAQQNTDLEQQKAALKQFMGQSISFLRKHPDQMLLWQLRAASSLSLNDPVAGYEAGQKLLAAGAADSNDPSLQQLLAELRNKGWLDKQKAEDDNKYGGVLGTWRLSSSTGDRPNQKSTGYIEVFSKSDQGDIEGRFIGGGHKRLEPDVRGTVLNSGEIKWEHYFTTSSTDPEWERRGSLVFTVNVIPGQKLYPAGWQPPISYVLSDDKRTMTMIFPQQGPANQRESIKYGLEHPVTLVFEKISDSQGQ